MAEHLQELRHGWPVLSVSVCSYFLLACLHSHVGPLLMLDVTSDLGMSITTYTLALGFGNLAKCVLLIVTGPAMDRFGAHNVANTTLAAGTLLVALLASAAGRNVFIGAIILLTASSAFAEQPTYVVINASHLHTLLSFATSCITSSFSASGAVLPLVLAPALEASGWRTASWCVAAACAIMLPLAILVLKPGSLSVGCGGASDAKQVGTSDVTAKEALQGSTLWLLMAALYTHLVYGATITSHLLTALRTDAGLSLADAAAVMALQFGSAIFAKLITGALIALPSPPHTFLFSAAPLGYWASHLLLLELDGQALSSFDVAHGLKVVSNMRRLQLYAVLVGFTFGIVFALIQCLPIRLFGRRDLPTLQSLMYISVLLGNATVIPLMGFLRDSFGQTYAVPFAVTFVASMLEIALLRILMHRDLAATSSYRYSPLWCSST